MTPIAGVPEPSIDFAEHVERDSAQFLAAIEDTERDAPVPTCPGWDASDLAWHLGQVQWLWGTVLRAPIVDHEEIARVERPERPDSHAGVLDHFQGTSAGLVAAIRDTDPAAERFMWAPFRTAGYIARRQAHEALIHRIDAELTAGREVSDIDATLAGDGVEEVLTVMYGVPGGPAVAEPVNIRFRATDTDRSWLATLAQGPGRPDDPTPRTGFALAREGTVAAFVTGSAADLDRWLWGRGADGVERKGDPDALARVDAIVATGV